MTGFAALPTTEAGGADGASQWSGAAQILGPRWVQLPALTIGFVGVQAMWSVEMSYGKSHGHIVFRLPWSSSQCVASPYLISLGLSKSLMAIVFLAGPISG